MPTQIDSSELESFILGYRSASWQQLVCSCTQNDGSFVEDSASILRRALIDYVLVNSLELEPELLRDLFVHEAEHSEHAQTVHENLAELATMMMESSGGHYVLEFLEGLSQTFDTQMALQGLTFSDETRAAATIRLRKIKQNLNDDDNELLNFGLDYLASPAE